MLDTAPTARFVSRFYKTYGPFSAVSFQCHATQMNILTTEFVEASEYTSTI